jgi:hypothetical protein
MNLPSIIPAPRRVRRKRKSDPPATPALGPVLVAASYGPNVGPTLILTFDRAINIDDFNGSVIFVSDGQFNFTRYNAGGEYQLDNPTTLRVTLGLWDEFESEGVWLNTLGETGIVAVDGGEPWTGATNLELPFP